jgi:1-acyl-sn-glycerol-3-phosphate acyltransferase
MTTTVPPRSVRRLVLDPLMVLLAVVALALLIPLAICTIAVDVVLRRPFPTTRLLLVGATHVVMEAVGVVCLTGLWLTCAVHGGVRSAYGQEAHHRFLRWWLTSVTGITAALIGIRVLIEDRRPPHPGPVLVFSRHAGPWDSFLLAHALARDYRRRPRVVMKAAMQWSPVVDLTGNRLPGRFIQPHGPDAKHAIGVIEELARGLGAHDAMVLFPEGGNFTARRRLAAIDRLVAEGHTHDAEEAKRLRNLVAPRPGGVLAAIRGAPDADVVFVAHTGLEPLDSLPKLWRQVPLRRALRGRYWRLPPSEIPTDDAAKIEWLFSWWATIDAWIEAHREAPLPADD